MFVDAVCVLTNFYSHSHLTFNSDLVSWCMESVNHFCTKPTRICFIYIYICVCVCVWLYTCFCEWGNVFVCVNVFMWLCILCEVGMIRFVYVQVIFLSFSSVCVRACVCVTDFFFFFFSVWLFLFCLFFLSVTDFRSFCVCITVV